MPPRVAWVLLPLALCCATAAAQDARPGGAFLAEGGVSAHGTAALAAGIWWPWDWQARRRGLWSASTEAWLGHWSVKEPAGGRTGFTQLGISPMVRVRFDGGRSPWFAEGGIGLSLNDRLYARDHKRFSTRLNFVDTLGVGWSFGAQREQELGLRLMHVSNAGLKKPNPGENFLLLRYARRF